MGEVTSLTRTLVSRDPAEAGHAARVTALAVRLAEAIGVAEERIRAIRLGGPLHDIGKLALDRSLLQKSGPLDGDELEEIRTHPARGVELVDGDDVAPEALDCILHHHERWDGRGYPDGLAGDEIPVEARILAVADAYDADDVAPSLPRGAHARRGHPRARAQRRLPVRPGSRRGVRRAAAQRVATASTRPRASSAFDESPRR